MNDKESPLGQRQKRRYGLFAGAIAGFAVLFVFAKSQGFLDDPALRVGVLGAVAGGLAGRIGSRRGVKGAALGIAFASLGMFAAIFILYR
jgi:hypothetical protein